MKTQVLPIKRVTVILALCALAAGLARAQSDAKPVFYVSFDGNITGHFGEFAFPTGVPPKLRYGQGVLGQAALLGWQVEYPIAEVFRPEGGTISVWLKLETKSAGMVVPGMVQHGWLACAGLDDPAFSALTGDGKWHHFAYTWDLKAKEMRQYLDGKFLRKAAYVKPFVERRYVFGDAGNWLDELVLLREPLSGRQVEELCAAYLKGKQPFEGLPKGATPFLPLDVSKFPPDRPALPRAVDWKSAKLEPMNRTRQQVSLVGLWRFQPLGFMERQPRKSQWLYVRLPCRWLPYPVAPVIFDRALKPLEGYNFLQHKMLSAVKAGSDGQILDEPEETAEEDDEFPGESRKGRLKEPGTYDGVPITNYCCVILEREFRLPADTQGKQVVLRMSRSDWVHVYLNGHYLGVVDYSGEAAIDLTAHLRPDAANTLTLVLGNTYLQFVSLGLTVPMAIELRSSAAVRLGQPLIVPSTRKKLLKVYLPAENLTGKPLELSFRAIVSDIRGKQMVTALGPVAVSLAKDASGDAVIDFPVKDIQEWSPETPNLYQLEVEASHEGTVIDIVPPERFGYREVWVENGEIYLNGKRLQLRGKSHAGWVAFTDLQLDLMRNLGWNSARTLDWNEWDFAPLDLTDEKGFLTNLIIWIIPGDLEASRAYFRGLMRLFGNHPSVIEWLIGGKGYVNGPHGHPMQIGGFVPEEIARNEPNYKLSRAINEVDPTGRPTFYHTDGVGGNVRGIMHSLSFGMPIQEIEEWVSHWAKVKQDPLVPREQQIFSRPDFFFHRGNRESIVLEQHARYFGDAAYRKATDPLIEFWQDIGEKNKWATPDYWMDMYDLAFTRALRSWRTYGISGYWFHASFHLQWMYEKGRAGGRLTRWGKCVKRLNAPCIFYIGGPKDDFVTKDHTYFDGETVSKSATVVNDSLHDIRGTVSWEASIDDGEGVGSGKQEVTVGQGTRFFLPVSLRCAGHELTIEARFNAPAEPLDVYDHFRISVLPRRPPAKMAETVTLADASGQTAAALKAMGVPLTVLGEGDADKLGASRLLVIGRNSFPLALKLFGGDKLNAAVEQGLNVLVLEQMNRNVAGLTTECFKTREVFPVAGDSTLLAGFQPEDFSDWRGESKTLPAYQSWCPESDWTVGANMLASKHGQANSFGQGRFWHWTNKGMVATFCYQKPQLGNFRVLLQNGFDTLYTPLVEFRKGKGRVLFCQLDVTDHYGTDPVATALFDRMVAEYVKPAAGELVSMGYLGGDEGRGLLGLLGVEFRDGLEGGVAYVSLAEADDKDAIERFVQAGGTVVVSPQDQSEADKLPVKLTIRKAEEIKKKAETAKPPDLPTVKLGEKEKPKEPEEDGIGVSLPGEDAGERPTTPAEPRGGKDDDFRIAPSGEGVPNYFWTRLPFDPVFSGVSLSDLYYRRPIRNLTVVESIDGKWAPDRLIGVVSHGKGRIVYIQPLPKLFDDPWQKTKVLRLYNTVLSNLGVKSRISPDFSLIEGYGLAEEWLPGYSPRVPNLDKRPTVKESPLYWKPALDFDPDMHYVW
jgi:beta-galactosidase